MACGEITQKRPRSMVKLNHSFFYLLLNISFLIVCPIPVFSFQTPPLLFHIIRIIMGPFLMV